MSKLLSNFKREIFSTLEKHLQEPRMFMQVLTGPRQTGKTTLAQQALESFKGKGIYASADVPTLTDVTWIEQQWNSARLAVKQTSDDVLLVLDEIQKIPRWSEAVKKLWDEDTAEKRPVKVLLLGSSPLLMQKGLTESLAGRFESLRGCIDEIILVVR